MDTLNGMVITKVLLRSSLRIKQRKGQKRGIENISCRIKYLTHRISSNRQQK